MTEENKTNQEHKHETIAGLKNGLEGLQWDKLKLKDFEVKERLAQKTKAGFQKFYGTTGAVYRASLKCLPEVDFALKILFTFDELETLAIRKRHEEEVKVAKSLRNANAAPGDYVTVLHDFVDRVCKETFQNWDADEAAEKTLFLVMPLINRTLRQEMTARYNSPRGYPYFSETEVAFILRRLLKLVQKLNSEYGIVHRDIKPDNIFLFDDDDDDKMQETNDLFRIALGDFGCAWDAKNEGFDKLTMPFPTNAIHKGRCTLLFSP